MKPVGILEQFGDALNPIVVKELRQGVQSRFVVVVLLLFLTVQVLVMGVFLLSSSIGGDLDSVEYQAGRPMLMFLQGILLGTCMLFIPVYSGLQLAAERSDVHVDLYFISALTPRSIIAGKFVAALVLAVLIFSACSPFMAFTYYLRGIDLATIFLMIAMDFLIVMVTVMVALFLAVVPANRAFKALLGLGGIFADLYGFVAAVVFTNAWFELGLIGMMDHAEFWFGCLAVVLLALAVIVVLFGCSVGLLSPLSANRTLPLRLWTTVWCLGSGLVMVYFVSQTRRDWPPVAWIIAVGVLVSLGLLISINEREQWAPRVARTIPRQWWLRPWAFLFYSGAAGGILWATLLFALCGSAVGALGLAVPSIKSQRASVALDIIIATVAYAYCYCLTAVFLRNVLFKITPIFTWILAVILFVLGSALPFLATFLIHQAAWDFWTHYPWLLTCPGAGMRVVESPEKGHNEVVFLFLAVWAVLVTALNGRWFVRQIRGFKRFAPAAGRESVPLILGATPMDLTRTVP